MNTMSFWKLEGRWAAALLMLLCLSNAHAGSAELVSLTDSIGNQQTNSIASNGQLGWPNSVDQPVVVSVGSQITFTAVGRDDEDTQLEFQFSVQRPGGSFQITQSWSINNSWSWNVSAEDFGKDVTVSVSVRDSDGLNEYGEFGGDDYTYAIYDVEDPNARIQPLITEFRDSLGNVTQNSFASNSQLGWPDSVTQPVRVNIGDRITLTVSANAFDGQQLQYQFAVQPPGGSLDIIRAWNSSPTATWTVASSQYGEGAFVAVFVRNQDGNNVFGSANGDDYASVEYFVNDPNASEPAVLDRVTDSLGNVQTNSFGDDDGNADWSSRQGPVPVVEGKLITFTASATDPDSNQLEYQFAIQRVGGSFDVRRGWSPVNTWTWQVNRDDFGKQLTVLVAVRDDDDRDFFGGFGGDDYTYLEYQVTVDITGAVNLIIQ